MPLEDFIIYVYCCVVDIYPQVVDTPLRCRGFDPKLTDSEVITMEIVGEFLGKDQDKGIWDLAVFWESLARVVSEFRITGELCQTVRQSMGEKATHTEAFINRAKRLWRSHPLG